MLSGSLYHFVWQAYYALGDEEMDAEHKDLFALANKLVDSGNKAELNRNIQVLLQHVKEHFAAEEASMRDVEFHGYRSHVKEHTFMLEKLENIDHKINHNEWNADDIEEFMDKWAKHILNSDMCFDIYCKTETV